MSKSRSRKAKPSPKPPKAVVPVYRDGDTVDAVVVSAAERGQGKGTVKSMPVNVPRRDEAVHHPAHYGGAQDPFEHIKVARGWGLENDAFLYNATKYICRAGRRPLDKAITDLQKAQFYLTERLKDLADKRAAKLRSRAR